MHAAFHRIDIIDKGVHGFTVSRLVLHGDIHNNTVSFSLKRNDAGIHQIFSFIQELNEFHNTAGITEYILMSRTVTDISQCDGEAFIQKRQLTHTDFQCIIIEIGAFFKYFSVRLESYLRPCFRCLPKSLHVLGYNTAGKLHLMEMPFSFYGDRRPFRQRRNDGNTYTMQAAGNWIPVAAEFTARMENGENDFHRRFSRFMEPCRYAAAVIGNRTAPVIIQSDLDMGAETGKGFINTVIYDFIHQMMQTAGRSRTDIHSRTETNRFQTFQHAYILRAVIAFPIFTGMMRLYFVDFLAHKISLKGGSQKMNCHYTLLLFHLFIFIQRNYTTKCISPHKVRRWLAVCPCSFLSRMVE